MRPSSLIGPFLLILVGAALLARNLWPQFGLGEIVARYWPLLFIFWGALRLSEILYWAAAAKPLPRAGISGGEWLLVLVLWGIGSAMHAYYGNGAHFFFNQRNWRGLIWNIGETYEYPLAPVAKNAGGQPRIVIEDFRGNAHITGADGDELTAGGRKTVRAFDEDMARRGDGETPLEVIGQNGSFVIRTNQDRAKGDLTVSEDLDITVPRGASVEAHGRAGRFDLSGIGGDVEITGNNTGVRLDNIGGSVHLVLRRADNLDLENISGPVTINGQLVGPVELRNLMQSVQYDAPRLKLAFANLPGQARFSPGQFTGSGIGGPVRIQARASDVNLNGFNESLDLSVDRGDIQLRPEKLPLTAMQVRARSGDVTLALPAGAQFDLDLSTRQGEADNEYGAPLMVSGTRRRAAIRGSVGAGPLLRLQTGRGAIKVQKASPEDLDAEKN